MNQHGAGGERIHKSFSEMVLSFLWMPYVFKKAGLSGSEVKEVKASMLKKTISSLLPLCFLLMGIAVFYFVFDCSQGLFVSPSYTSPELAVLGEALIFFPSLFLLIYQLAFHFQDPSSTWRNRIVLFVFYLCVLSGALTFMHKDFLYLLRTANSIYTFSVFFFTLFAFFPDFFFPENLILAVLELGCPPLLVVFSGVSWNGYYQVFIIGLVCVLGSFYIGTKNADSEILLLENHKANETLEEMSCVDQLTKDYNRYALGKDYSKTLRWLQERKNDSLCLFMIDIDEFKKYNDAFSHVQGDNCLSMISGCLMNLLSERGMRLYRYGGEEFIAMMVGKKEDAIALGETMRQAVKDLKIENPPTVPQQKYLTISIGIASEKPEECPSLENFIFCTDEQLYKSKQSGRDACFFQGKKISLS
jgi:diguanylate cyclase (GGDEF)-like protein